MPLPAALQRRSRQLGLLLLLLLALGGLGGLATGTWRLAPPATRAARATLPAGSVPGPLALQPASADLPSGRASDRQRAAFAQAPGLPPPASTAPPAPATVSGECGMDEAPVAPSDDSGNADAPAAGASHPGRPAGPHFLAAQTRLRAALRGSAAPYTQGVGEWIDTFQGPDAGTHLEALAAMAVGTRDPRLYALAFRACRHLDVRDGSTSPPPPSCDRLDARQWARLDAGNAVPWADLLAEAQARGDLSGQQEALFHIAEAQRWADRFYDPAGIIGAQLQEEPDTLAARTTLLVEALGYSGAAMVTTTPISRACSPTAVGDANRRQLCTRIAALMYDRSDNLVAAVLGSRYHQYATGDASWRTALEKERGRYADRPYERPVGDKTPLPCTPLQTLMDDIRDMARLGERQAHQAWRKAGARP